MANRDTDIFKIRTNNMLPAQGNILISEPFLRDSTFGRSVILLVDYSNEGSMGIIMNKQLPITVNDLIKEFRYLDDIPLFRGGPLSTDTLFYLHTFKEIEGAYPVGNGIFLNGDFNAIKRYVLQGNPIQGNIRFFLGYSGWEYQQLLQEIEENTWLVGKGEPLSIMNTQTENLWKSSLGRLGDKYETWSRFPQVPSFN